MTYKQSNVSSTRYQLAGLLFVVLSLNTVSAYGTSGDHAVRAESLLGQGRYHLAIQQWKKHLSALPDDGHYRDRAMIYQQMAHAHQMLGRVDDAHTALLRAGELAKKSNDKTLQYSITADIGSMQIAQGNLKLAKRLLMKSLHHFTSNHNFEMQSAVLNDLGRIRWLEGDIAGAEKAFSDSYTLAEQHSLRRQAIPARLNYAILMFREKNYDSVKAAIQHIATLLKSLPGGITKRIHQLEMAELGIAMMETTGEDAKLLPEVCYKSLNDAYTTSKAKQDYRNESYALGLLGKLYHLLDRPEEANSWYNRAVDVAQEHNISDLLYRWQWYAGRVQRENGRLKQAVQYYRNAYYAYQDVDPLILFQDFARQQPIDRPSDFFYEMADLILNLAGEEDNQQQLQDLLLSAVDTVENLKNTELQDYFKDDCVAQTRHRYATVRKRKNKETAVVYSIAFVDRLEIIVNFHGIIKRFTQDVDKKTITKTVSEFRDEIEKRRSRSYLSAAKKLYGWYIKPLEHDLVQREIKTLVFIPDVSLRSLPFSALHSGERFLLEDYMIAMSPGIELTSGQPSSRNNTSIMLAGLSQSVQGYPSLNYVETELRNIQNLFGGKVLIDKEFSSQNISGTLSQEQFSIAHIASHGEFRGNVNQSFILTYDGKISVNDMARYIGAARFQDQPIELLTLSACYTASGDEKAMLGLAGITVKSGALSALATLWPVNDIATSTLMTEFYTQLKDPGNSKAKALQLAQKKLLTDKRYRHPGYWSPFVLIGNWH